MFGPRERYLRKCQTLPCFSYLTLEHTMIFATIIFVGILGVFLFCYLSSFQSFEDVEMPSCVETPSTDMQLELPMSEFQVWSKVIRSCDLSLEEEADSSQPAIEFSRNRVIERPWDVWIRKFIRFFYLRNNALHLRTSQLMERHSIGDAFSVTNPILLAIESISDLTRAIIEREGVTSHGLHFALIQLCGKFPFINDYFREMTTLSFTIKCFQTYLRIAMRIPVR